MFRVPASASLIAAAAGDVFFDCVGEDGMLYCKMREYHKKWKFTALVYVQAAILYERSQKRTKTCAARLTELLRPETETISVSAAALLEEVKQNYEVTVNAIRTYLESDG